ncbi:predicted protein [Ostreococcus lucimarinus CCE9901]|uniref:Acyltransferase n=1 Tax=Ostreococcus lucimarinus (strain CCE9901) TaxID=436017 RepID=A4S5J7_OSTLU|nr:predicted protein [Ostreococcus lucimarinus CCE9901]ABO99076.1 predicted protein [Ostreococcus lucimarinus CCE9901]|eukprot:XP_001420783.1 predicted protein [Ostreococcus lucimarinus CCE9901]
MRAPADAAIDWRAPSAGALACLLAVAITNFGVGGALFGGRGWRAWQPFARGRSWRFTLAQAIGWTLASASLACVMACGTLVWRDARDARDDGTRERRLAVAALSWTSLGLSVASEAAVAASLAFFDVQDEGEAGRGAARGREGLDFRDVARVATLLSIAHVLHAPHAVIFATLATVYALGSSGALASIVVLYASTYFLQRDLERGRRKWDAFRAWSSRWIEGAAKAWHGSVRMIHDGAHGAGSTPLVFAYHPHSLIPAGAVWFHFLPQFGRRFENVKPVTLAASVLFKPPFVRELAAWLGVRSVSQEIFRSTLRHERAVVVCPGGQGEMCEHVGGLKEETITLCTKHRGFVRLAIEEKARLVPVVCFGESSSWRNLLRHPGRYLYRRFRVATPLLAVGYLGILPIPARVPLTFVVGDPMSLPEPDDAGRARESDVEIAHAAYYREVARLFAKHKGASGFPNLNLKLLHE